MVNLQELSFYLDDLLRVDQFRDFCPNGLQVEGKQEVRKVLFAVTASQKAIEYAAHNQFDALICHHGLFWDKQSQVVRHSMKKRLKPLLENEISLLSYHLPLDAHEKYGNNFGAAKKLGLKQLQSFLDFGVKGVLDATPIDELVTALEKFYQHKAITALGGKKQVESVAIVSGGGWRFLTDAYLQNVDLLVTGNFDEPAWHIAHENQIHFIALGHDATEQIGVQLLKEHLEKQFSIEAQFLDLQNPF